LLVCSSSFSTELPPFTSPIAPRHATQARGDKKADDVKTSTTLFVIVTSGPNITLPVAAQRALELGIPFFHVNQALATAAGVVLVLAPRGAARGGQGGHSARPRNSAGALAPVVAPVELSAKGQLLLKQTSTTVGRCKLNPVDIEVRVERYWFQRLKLKRTEA
jgi:hypothetical protein